MQSQQTRREFLKQCLGGFALSPLFTGATTAHASASKDSALAKRQSGQGYQLTEHVRAYYQKAAF